MGQLFITDFIPTFFFFLPLQVYVGPQSHMVWALDSAGNVYAREAIFPDYLLGTGWVPVPGISALQLSIRLVYFFNKILFFS